MKKIIKALKVLVIISVIAITFFMPNNNEVQAKTLRQLKEELAAKEQELVNGQNQKKYTEEQIKQKRDSITKINNEILAIGEEISDLTLEIEALNEEIALKEQEIKKIMNYYQLSNGESAYLEYIFKANDYTDFIYRMAISEQLSNYNDKLITEYNEKIKENEKKKEELAKKRISLNESQNELQKELESLGSQLGSIMDENVTLEDDIVSMRKMIDTYENVYNCQLDDDLNECSRGKLPPDVKFIRPVDSGTITSNYGWYYPWGYAQWHYGMDIGAWHGSNVYSMANGRVAYITYRAGCGGNMVYIHHNINGDRYTTGYFHLGNVYVDVGDIVTVDTVIGTVGGSSYYEWWDSCSTGAHLHIQVSYDNIPSQAGFYTAFAAKSFDPRLVINFPCEGCWFGNRTSKY